MVYGWISVCFFRYNVISKMVGEGPRLLGNPQGRHSSTIQSVISSGRPLYYYTCTKNKFNSLTH